MLAKQMRDAWMRQGGQWGPRYQFEKHKGYPTPLHLELLEALGPSRHHRVTYAPVRAVLERARS